VTRPRTVDLHAHLAVPAANELLAGSAGLAAEMAAEQAAHSPASLAANQAQLARLGPQLTDVPTRLAAMAAQGIDVQAVGPMPMHHYWADRDLASKLTRVKNDAIAAHCAAAPDRLLGIGTIPLQHPDLAVAALTEAVTGLGFRGVTVSTNVDGRELADPRHDPVWARAEELGAVVLIHPWGCSLGSRLAGNYLGNTVGQPVETTVALSHLIFSGTLDRFPGLKLCAAHGGGYLPTYIGRSDHAWRVRPDARGCANLPSSYLRRIWYDSLVYTAPALEFLVATVGADKVVLGTDYPFDMGVTDPLARLDATSLPSPTREAIRSANAWALLTTTALTTAALTTTASPSPAAPTFTGRLVLRGDADFAAARVDRVFNRRLTDRQPAAVLYAETDQDVVNGVRLARERGWQVAVRAGGHSWAQWSVRDNALLIDLGARKEIDYDEQTEIVSVSPSVKGGEELDPYLAERGRFFAGGHCPTVGVGGFLLQGGQGWNARGWGWAAEQIVAIDVVTADGDLVRADATRHSDLYWAARGAGPGFFGVVTRFHLATRPRPRHISHTVQVYAMTDFDEVMTWLQGMHQDVADTVEIVAIGLTPADAPEPVLVVTALAFADDQEEALRVLRPFEDCPAIGRALTRQYAKPSSLAEQRAEQIRANPEGHRWRVDNAWLRGGPEQVVPAIREAFAGLPNKKAFSIWFSMAPLRHLPDMAFSLQSEIYFATYVLWDDPEDDDACRQWVTDRMRDLEPVTAGHYLGDSDLATRQVKFMSDENWQRLAEIRAKRDPSALFAGYLAGPEGALNRNHWQ